MRTERCIWWIVPSAASASDGCAGYAEQQDVRLRAAHEIDGGIVAGYLADDADSLIRVEQVGEPIPEDRVRIRNRDANG